MRWPERIKFESLAFPGALGKTMGHRLLASRAASKIWDGLVFPNRGDSP
jgi:hypothetical protein